MHLCERCIYLTRCINGFSPCEHRHLSYYICFTCLKKGGKNFLGWVDPQVLIARCHMLHVTRKTVTTDSAVLSWSVMLLVNKFCLEAAALRISQLEFVVRFAFCLNIRLFVLSFVSTLSGTCTSDIPSDVVDGYVLLHLDCLVGWQ